MSAKEMPDAQRQVFLDNLDVCRSQALQFSRPLDARDFPGSELLLSDSQHASANMLMLITRLRGILEGGYSNSSGIEKLSLFNRAGERVGCELSVQEDVLQRWLRDRIVLGVKNFFTALHAAFASRMPDAVHILLAGNASRSRMLPAAWVARAMLVPSSTLTMPNSPTGLPRAIRSYKKLTINSIESDG